MELTFKNFVSITCQTAFLLHAKATLSAQHASLLAQRASLKKRLSACETGLMRAFILCCAWIHVYKDIWTSAHGEELQCQCEAGNVVCCFHYAMWSHA